VSSYFPCFASSMKFLTDSGALSLYSSALIVPWFVSITAIGFPHAVISRGISSRSVNFFIGLVLNISVGMRFAVLGSSIATFCGISTENVVGFAGLIRFN